MRDIKEATYNAIKNRATIGEFGFRSQVLIEDYKPGFGPINNTAMNVLSTGSKADYCFRKDGKILYGYISGTVLYLKVIESEEVMMSEPNSGDGGTQFTTVSSDGSDFSLFKTKTGKLLLIVGDAGKYGGANWTIKIYSSANGLGDDFSLANTLDNSPRVNSLTGYTRPYVSKPTQTKDGGIVFLANIRRTSSSYDFFRLNVFKSVDDGVGWSVKNSYTPGSSTESFRVDKYHNPVSIGDFNFITYRYGANPIISYAFYSENSGETWTGPINITSGFPIVDYHCIASFATDGTDLFMVKTTGTSRAQNSLYKFTASTLNIMGIQNIANWELIRNGIENNTNTLVGGTLSISNSGTLHWLNYIYGGGVKDFSATREYIDSKFIASNIVISKSTGGASTAMLVVDNRNGVVNPRNPEGPLYGILNLNKQIIIKQGYGDDLVDSFTGIIDSINMSTFPQVAQISLRDNFKKALDQTVTKNGSMVVKYTNQPIENIVADLCTLCGLTVGFIEPTGISIEKTFSWQSYADAFSFLSDIASFEYLCDESGKFHFRRDFQPGDMYVAWSFKEGEDIASMTYSIDDNDLYKSVRVYGKSGDTVLVYNAPFLDAAEFNILPQKVLKIDATEASSTLELKKIAERALATMRSRTRVIEFTSVAIPHLQVGDFIQIFESSTNSHEIYRLTSISLTMDSKRFVMSCKAYYYGDVIVPGDLPTDTETQSPNETLNLIPEMTSNTKPSGVARSSSIYVLYNINYHPWRAFNSSSSDYFWDASETQQAWIEYEFPKKTIVDKYSIKARQDTTWNKALPRNWTFQAYDGEKWITLDTRTNQTSWGVYEWRSYKFVNTTPYAKYRLKITKNNGYVRTQIEQLAMYYTGGI